MHHHVHGTYDSMLVVFSYVVAVAASYTVLDLVERIVASIGWRKWVWLTYGAIAMGMGIWSMHFVGMLAFSLPEPVAYDLGEVLLSVVAAIGGSFFALLVVSRGRLDPLRLISGGVLLAAGICAMHYIGMAAMVIGISYNYSYVAASIVIALIASIAALWLSLYFRREGSRVDGWKKLGSGLIMGGAIAGMHYVGMVAASFHVDESRSSSLGMVLDQKWLAYLISGGTLYTLGLSLLGMFISKRFSYKDSEIMAKTNEIHKMNQELRQMNDHLEELVADRTAQLEQARDEAVMANRIKSQFLANMSHELRTPLNAIIGYSEMLEEEASEIGEPAFAEDLAKISKSGKHLLSLINDILDISKIEAGKMEVYVETFELADLVADVASTVRPLVEGNGNRLETRSAQGEMTTDMTKLRQILFNLLSNAGKFTKNGIVECEAEPETRDGRMGYSFRVRDSGIGMTTEQVDKLFQPFTQADASTTRQYGGTGLGLAISRSFCQLLGGEIAVDSSPGAGSTFTFWLPADHRSTGQSERSVDAAPPSATRPGNDSERSRVHVLLIDDEPVNGQLMKRYLEQEGWTLAVAENGAEGLKLAGELRPDVICLDILMPGMDGWSVLQTIKSDPRLQDIPVVIWSMTGDKTLGFSLGASDFLMKPIDRARLSKIMEKYVTSRSRHTVLVIEDDTATSELMTKLLQKEGYIVTQAGNGRLALECLEREVPRLILLDLMMPEMDGFEFVAEMRKQEPWRDIPIVVVTAKTITAEDRIKLDNQVRSVIQKGASIRQSLLTEIRRFVRAQED